MIAPALEEIAGTLGEKVKIVKLNVDENPATASKYGIMSIPTLMMFKNGEMASRQVGAAPKQKLEQWINGRGLSDRLRTMVCTYYGRRGSSRPFAFWLRRVHAGKACRSRPAPRRRDRASR